MKLKTVCTFIILQFLIIGCAGNPAIQTDNVQATATVCVTRTAEATTSVSVNETINPEQGTAIAGLTGEFSQRSGTPDPGQIATSQAMEAQSNRDGPPLDPSSLTLTPDTWPIGPGLPEPASGTVTITITPSITATATASPAVETTHQESGQPYPEDATQTSVVICP